MIESASALARVEEIAAVDGVDQLFVGPYDLSLSLGTTVQALLDDDSEGNPLARIVETAAAYGRVVGGFAGTLILLGASVNAASRASRWQPISGSRLRALSAALRVGSSPS